MIFPLLIFGALGFALALGVSNQPKAGHGPFDVLPAWVLTGPKGKPSHVRARSGREYLVSTWPPVAGDQYEVAVLATDPKIWIGYVVNRDTGARRLFRASAATAAGRDAMLTDFGVSAT